MATYKATSVKSKTAPKYPSGYGSHESMIDGDNAEFNSGNHGQVICRDDRGLYLTYRTELDSGFCDYNRTVNIELRIERLDEALKGSD